MRPAAPYGRVLAILFILWGCLHLGVGAFWWSIIFGLAREGYTEVLLDLKTSIALALTISMVVLPLVSGIALLRAGSWSGGAVLVTCVVILIVNFILLRQVASPRLSAARIVFGALYGGANLAISA